jgi:hypothetical protein
MMVDAEDFKILARDQKVTHLMEQTHELFTERYKAFEELMKIK